jgi:short-subunit dehydrogenase
VTIYNAFGDRIVLVTGASRGIKRAIALGLAAAGADVCLAARSPVALEGVAAEVRRYGVSAIFVSCDLTHDEEAERLVDACVCNWVRSTSWSTTPGVRRA